MDFRKDLIRTFYPSMPNRINNTATNFDAWLSQPVSETETLISEGTLPEKTMAEHIIDHYVSTVLPSSSVSVKDWKDHEAKYIRQDLKYLNRKLSVVRKTITSWDTYKITEVVTDPNTLGAKIQGLPLNSSLIVNTPTSVSLNNVTYSMGDIAFKDINGTLHNFKSQPSGFFFPSYIGKFDSNINTVQITYSFAAGSQPSSESATIEGTPLEEAAQKISAKITLTEDTVPYNYHFRLEKGKTYTKETINYKTGVPPKVFAYIISESLKGEEIYIDQDQLWSTDGKTITVVNNTDFDLYITMR